MPLYCCLPDTMASVASVGHQRGALIN
uniref:Uncharacterized protein n=1 Tax=Arundo donax TaxID=35708 RepID=A0A0A9BQC0_ARUDO